MISKIQFKIRTGTGEKGSESSPLSLTFDFAWEFIVCIGKSITEYNNGPYGFYGLGANNILVCGGAISSLLTEEFQNRSFMVDTTCDKYNKKSMCKKSSDSKTIYWYGAGSNTDSSTALNESGVIYGFLAFATSI